jgi:hypothetical protein
MSLADDSIKDLLNKQLGKLEVHFKADLFSFYGPIIDGSESFVLKVIEKLSNDKKKKDSLYVILTTPGRSAIAVERYVNIFRKHYKEVNFIVPDYAFSAGTILCMSGDNILMDYYSVLGPIDPQVPNKEGNLVSALGYLDKVSELIKKAQNNTLTNAEFVILKEMDLAELRGYEQARELTTDLLKRWLVQYKFKNWNNHQTDPAKIGNPVTQVEKEERAIDIATKLSDNNIWKTHGRPININTLVKDLRLKIEDYSDKRNEQELIRNYYLLLTDYIGKIRLKFFLHTRSFI